MQVPSATAGDNRSSRRGTVSGLLGLSRNIGLVAGASAMGAVFAGGVGTGDFTRAATSAIATGMRLTFLLASAMMIVAVAITFGRPNAQTGSAR